jgi:hypothetical protein
MKSKILPFLQQLVTADKTPIAGAMVGALTVLAAKFGFRMNASDTAYLAVAVSAGIGLFTHAHFANQAQKAKS